MWWCQNDWLLSFFYFVSMWWSWNAVHWLPQGSNSAHSLLSIPGDRAHWVYMIVLLRRWSCKGCSLVTLGNLLGDRAPSVDTICLIRRWSWKGNPLVTLGKALLYTFIVQVSLDKECLEWMCWPGKDWFWTGSTLRGCGSLERTDFNNFHFEMVWWAWKNYFFLQFLLWEGVLVLKGLIFNNY